MITCKCFVCCGIGEKREEAESGKPSKVIADQEESGKVKTPTELIESIGVVVGAHLIMTTLANKKRRVFT
jgi:hypothetical protein